MGIQEGEGVAGGNGGTQKASGDESFPFSLADDTDDVQLLQILIQLVLQHIWEDTRDELINSFHNNSNFMQLYLKSFWWYSVL